MSSTPNFVAEDFLCPALTLIPDAMTDFPSRLRDYTVAVQPADTLRPAQLRISAHDRSDAISAVRELFPDMRVVSVSLTPAWNASL